VQIARRCARGRLDAVWKGSRCFRNAERERKTDERLRLGSILLGLVVVVRALHKDNRAPASLCDADAGPFTP